MLIAKLDVKVVCFAVSRLGCDLDVESYHRLKNVFTAYLPDTKQKGGDYFAVNGFSLAGYFAVRHL